MINYYLRIVKKALQYNIKSIFVAIFNDFLNSYPLAEKAVKLWITLNHNHQLPNSIHPNIIEVFNLTSIKHGFKDQI